MISKYKVLYAEDEDAIRKGYVSTLKLYFSEVIEASDGDEAYEKYIEHKPSLLILDINMPKLNGLELAKKIRIEDKKIKIIILSALGDQDTLIKACELNLLKYLLKPIKTIELDTVLNSIITELNKNKLIFDIKTSQLLENNIRIKLTKNELELIKLLYLNKNSIVSNSDILNYLWEDTIDDSIDINNKLRILVYRLNKKFTNEVIFSTYGVGYQLNM